MAKKKVKISEIERRKKQASADKKKQTRNAPRPVRTLKSKQKAKGSTGGSFPYARLVLDPCNASFCQTNLPGSSGSQQMRCPFRQIYTVPTATTDINGLATSGGTVCDTLQALLVPHAMWPGNGPAAIAVTSKASETDVTPAAGYISSATRYAKADPAGLTGLIAIAGEMRPVAACIRITCLGSDQNNTGLFFGYEGAAKQFIAHGDGSYLNPYVSVGTAQNVIFNGQSCSDTYKTYEVRINFPNANPNWQDWRAVNSQLASSGLIESSDANDLNFSEMPIAMVGVTSATPGTRYLFDGAIVYEWQPQTINGMVGPKKIPANPGALASVAKSVQNVANSWGGMLISTAADYASGGSASAVMGLLRQGYASYTAKNSKQPLLLGWK